MKEIITFILILVILTLSPLWGGPGRGCYAQELQPNATEALLEVIYKHPDTDQPIPNGTIILEDVKTKERKTFQTDDKGRFQVIFSQGKKYKIYVKSEGQLTGFDDLLDIPKADGPYIYTYTIYKPIFKYFKTKTYVLNIRFETGKSTLSPESYAYLNQFYDTLNTNPDMVVEIGGHTDNVGDAHSNQKLSEARANIARTYLIEKGIAPGRITAVGYGEMRPIASNETPEGRQKNRRTEVKILSE